MHLGLFRKPFFRFQSYYKLTNCNIFHLFNPFGACCQLKIYQFLFSERILSSNNSKTTDNFDLKSRQGAAWVFFARQQISDVYMDEETCPPRETDRQPIDLVTTEKKTQFLKNIVYYFCDQASNITSLKQALKSNIIGKKWIQANKHETTSRIYIVLLTTQEAQ